jgi:hypothetical protein
MQEAYHCATADHQEPSRSSKQRHGVCLSCPWVLQIPSSAATGPDCVLLVLEEQHMVTINSALNHSIHRKILNHINQPHMQILALLSLSQI